MRDPNYQKRLLALCEALIDCKPDELEARLETECAGDQKLRAGVEAMLARVVQNSNEDLEFAAASYSVNNQLPPPIAPTTGDQIVGFRLHERLGRGGMGEVFRGVRVDASFSQNVAIKVLHAQILTPDLRLRFNQEREILARMHHPYIATLIDGGTTDKGVPFLIMELVNGEPIDEYCDRKRLPLSERIALLEKVAAALQYAHQNLTIHRDLKPNNVLVTEDGIPKLVDFGIAKLLTSPDQSESNDRQQPGATTLFGQRVLTPDYASPEQVLHGNISISSDIYSLGILAIALLTGRKPYELSKLSARDMLNVMERSTTKRASALLKQPGAIPHVTAIAQARSSTPGRLRRAINGDLDTVLARATNREPSRRYASAEEFGRDLANARNGLPVMARGDALSYRIWSFIRTNRLAASVTAATLAALGIGLVAALWQARIAEERVTDLHGFARTVLGDIYDSVADLPGSTPTRKLMADEAQHYLDRLASSGFNNPQLRRDLALAYKRLADVQGLPTNANLGESANALTNYRKAQAIAEQLTNESPTDLKARAQIYKRMADVLAWQGDIHDARDKLEQSLGLFTELLKDRPKAPEALVDFAYNLVKLGDILGHPSFPNLGLTDDAERAYEEGLSLLTEPANSTDDWELRRCYTLLLERSGTMALLRNDTPKALREYTLSKNLRVEMANARPDHADMQRDAGIASEKIADLYQAQGRHADALLHYEAALVIYKHLVQIDPENANALRTLAIGRENLAEALMAVAKNSTARAEYRAAETIRLRLLERDPDSQRLRRELRKTQEQLARLRLPASST